LFFWFVSLKEGDAMSATTESSGKAMTEAAYHSHPAMSYSKLKVAIQDGWREFEGKYITKTLAERKSDEMEIGTVVHILLCEPSRRGDVILIPDEVLASNGARSGNAWKAFAAEHNGRILLKRDQFNHCLRLVDRVHKHPIAGKLLKEVDVWEEPRFWTHKPSGVECRCKVDAQITKHRWRMDVKTSADAMPEGFSKSIADFFYHLQTAMYLDSFDDDTDEWKWTWLVVQTEGLPRVRCYEIDATALALGRDLMDRYLDEYHERRERNDWSDDNEDKIVAIAPPGWHFKKFEV
jgi:hypothetical protein